MKKLTATISVLLVLVMVLSAPASALAIITSDTFSTSAKSADKWVTDRYEPEEFDRSDGKLYLSVGPKGYYKYRADDKKDKYYALQGKKLPVEMPSSNTWTATVKINVDDNWFSSSDGRRRAEFRVDLVDGDGNALKNSSPAIALVKGGSGAPVLKYYNPKAQGSWGMATRFVNGDKETEDLTVEDGWHSLLIKANNGVLTYYFDEKKLGNCTLTTKDVYPSFIALNVYNYDRPQMVEWDNVTLYDGSYIIRQLSSEAQDKKDERLESQYEKKRNNWEDKYTEYMFGGRSGSGTFKIENVTLKKGEYYTQSKLKSLFKISEKDWDDENDQLKDILSDIEAMGISVDPHEKKEMPDSYWDY